jgi:hypothetical protein
MKPSQNPLFKADTFVRPVAERGFLELVQGSKAVSKRTIFETYSGGTI